MPTCRDLPESIANEVRRLVLQQIAGNVKLHRLVHENVAEMSRQQDDSGGAAMISKLWNDVERIETWELQIKHRDVGSRLQNEIASLSSTRLSSHNFERGIQVQQESE